MTFDADPPEPEPNPRAAGKARIKKARSRFLGPPASNPGPQTEPWVDPPPKNAKAIMAKIRKTAAYQRGLAHAGEERNQL